MLGLDFAGLDAIGDDLEEIEENFENENENDETEPIEEIQNLSQEFNEVLSQEANEVVLKTPFQSLGFF